MHYFSKLLDLLKTERQADQQAYQELTSKLTIAERRENGMAWYPVAIRGSEMSRGDYLTVELERTTHHDITHQLRFGMPAVLFSNHDVKQFRAEGIIAHQSNNTLKLTLHTDELPEWSRNGKLGVELLFDDNSYDEMADALRYASALSEKQKEGRLVHILTGQLKPTFHPLPEPVTISSLNASQQSAVKKILEANELAIVHGPPGTGKTTTLVQAIKAIAGRERQQVLVTAPSNTAVDLLSERLSEEGLNVVRIGNPVRVSERLLSLTLDSKMAAHKSMKNIRELKKQANEYRNMAHKYKRHFGKAEREQRKALFDEAYKIMKEVTDTEQYIADDVLGRAQVIAATLAGANHYPVRKLKYHTVVIDEAGQATEPSCWIPAVKAQKLVLAGDHCQLPPTIKSQEAARQGLGTTLLEKCVALHPGSVTLLEEQYRMHETIMRFSSQEFYENRLKAHPSVAQRLLFPGDAPLAFIDTAGCGFEEKTEGNSISNPEEAAFLFKHLVQFTTHLQTVFAPGDYPSIAVISPYRRQITLLKEQLEHTPVLQPWREKITVNTIDSFQGQERDVVYIGLTRSNADGSIGFLSEIRRMNVAMTRARKKLVVIGDSATLSGFPFYHDFITYAEKENAYQSAWEFMET